MIFGPWLYAKRKIQLSPYKEVIVNLVVTYAKTLILVWFILQRILFSLIQKAKLMKVILQDLK